MEAQAARSSLLSILQTTDG